MMQEKQERKVTYFASDAHLGLDIYEAPIEAEKRLVRWMDMIMPTAKALYLVGDMFDYWFEYRDVVPKGFVRFIGKMAEFVDAGIPVYLFTGNHDIWMFDYFQKEVGVTVCTESVEHEIDGKRFFVAHGDGLGDPSLSFRFLRSFFRNKFCQRLYKMIHPRLTVPFGYAWSRYNRKRKEGNYAEAYLGEDKEYLVKFSKEHVKNHEVDFYVYGHRHIVLDLPIEKPIEKSVEKNTRVIILGDWIRKFSYASWDGETMKIAYFQ